MDPLFQPGEIVCLRAEPARVGPVVKVLSPIGGVSRYRVFHSPAEVRDYREDQLLAVMTTPPADALEEAVAAGRWLHGDLFRARLTAERLSHPLIDNLYAFQAARIQFIPFQLKPLLRFIRADQPRMLVADEVGVGKTIEAGLILKELQTRQRVDNVLIVCPKALVSKWRMEMRRFDEDFRPLTSETLRYCLREAHMDGAWPAQYSRAICHLELLRVEEIMTGTSGRRPRPGLMTLDPPPQFTLAIFDEAHHLRNPGTRSHDLARYVCDVSEAVLFLSATPLHLGSENLFALLNLLRPDLFPDAAVFAAMSEPNQHLTQAMRYVRTRLPQDGWQEAAANALAAAGATSWGQQVLRQDPSFSAWQDRLRRGGVGDDAGRVRCLRELEELHTLAHVMNRTRRRDIGAFTLREAHTIQVDFTPHQRDLYDALLDFRMEMLLRQLDPNVASLVMDTLERQAASCLHALVPTLSAFVRSGRFSGYSDDPELDDVEPDLPPLLAAKAEELRQRAQQLPPDDPKLVRLLEIVRETLATPGPGKVLVFSYFLHTLDYLRQHLQSAGVRVEVVNGRLPDVEREHLRDRFRLPREDPGSLDVLLSSEVGCEGLDYQFCDRLVNYDLPWNPMRIEQRIGRIDRYGQTSPKVLIFNFITPGTVEERIFFRCFDRLGIFQSAIGDLEEVLGELTHGLTQLVLDPNLTPEQAEEKARQTADNAVRLIEERRWLEEQSGALIGLDSALLEEVDRIQAEGRFVSPSDLLVMIQRFLEQPEYGGRLVPDEKHERTLRLRLNRSGRAALGEQVRALERNDRMTLEFSRWLDGSESSLSLTFDQQTALAQRELPFVTPVHPLARVAIKHWASERTPLASRFVVTEEAISSGTYLFVFDLWETIGVRPEVRLFGLAWDVAANQLAPAVAEDLVRLLGRAAGLPDGRGLDGILVYDAFRQLDEEAQRRWEEALSELHEWNASQAAGKLATLDTYYGNRLQRVNAELSQVTDEKIRRMKASEQARIQRDYEQKRAEMENRSAADIISQRIAAGVIEVRHGQ